MPSPDPMPGPPGRPILLTRAEDEVIDVTPTGGNQNSETVRDPKLPRTDDPVRQTEEQDDSTKATAGVKLPGGTKIEATSDGTQAGGQITIPLDPNPPKPPDTSPRTVNPDAPPDPGSCVGEDGGTYPNGWEIFKDNVAVSKCVNGQMTVIRSPA
jgi:hypothetical protein